MALLNQLATKWDSDDCCVVGLNGSSGTAIKMSSSTINLHSPLSPHAGGQELVCKVRIHTSSDWSEDRTRIDQRRHWVCSVQHNEMVSGMGLAITGLSATEKQGNINQDINPPHCAFSSRGEALLLFKRSP